MREKKQKVNLSAVKNRKERNPLFGWIATDRPLDIPSNNLNSAPSTETLIHFLAGEWG